ncbi:MAG: hypothetical protein HYU75_14735, partial [Betaproteobacteria bacterium]|nr:hypothetical protein [Betaproteobacteria bacterium]
MATAGYHYFCEPIDYDTEAICPSIDLAAEKNARNRGRGIIVAGAFVPYGIYWSTPFAKWQGSLAHLHSIKLAARVARASLESKNFPLEAIDYGVLGITIPQPSSFFGVPWAMGMMGLEGVTGPTVQQACATSARALQVAAQEIACGTASCALVITADRMSNGPILYYPDGTAPGAQGVSLSSTLDNFDNDPYARNAMID